MEQIESLEVKLAFLEKQLLDLSDVVREVADKLADVEREMTGLRERLHSEDVAGTGPEKPPHY